MNKAYKYKLDTQEEVKREKGSHKRTSTPMTDTHQMDGVLF